MYRGPAKFILKIFDNYCWPISLILLCVITYLSLSPLMELPKVPGTDKLHHLLAYASLALPISIKGGGRWWLALVFYLLWSAGIELVQPFVNRYGELDDFLANAAGIALGAFVGLGFRFVANKSG